MADDWLLWQLCDSAFPMGAFAHSGGLEAVWQHGALSPEGLEDWALTAVRQVGASQAPIVSAAHAGAPCLAEVDAFCDSLLLNHIANRASRAQGQTMLMACARAFPEPELGRLLDELRAGRLVGHAAAMFGASTRALGVEEGRAVRMFLFMATRGVISAAVRLGIVGPLQGQSIQRRLSGAAEQVARECQGRPLDEAAHVSPVLDLLQATQDRLYSRLFVS